MRSTFCLPSCSRPHAFVHRWTPTPTPDEVAFEAIKAGIDSMPPGVKMILNSGEHAARVLASSVQIFTNFQASSTLRTLEPPTSSSWPASLKSTLNTLTGLSSPSRQAPFWHDSNQFINASAQGGGTPGFPNPDSS